MTPARGCALGILLPILLAACAGQAEREDPALAALRDQQAAAESTALRALAARRCAGLPERAELRGLPADRLDCLGTGPARRASAGDGRPTVVNLWASWCAPCVREMPLLQRTATQAGAGVRFVGIDVEDEPASAAGLLQATGVRYDQYADPDGDVRRALRAVGLPVTVVYAADGRQVDRSLGEVDAGWLERALRKAGAAPRAAG